MMSNEFNEHRNYLTAQKVEEILREGEENRLRLKNRWQTEETKIALMKAILALQSGQPWAHLLSNLPCLTDKTKKVES